MTFPLVVRVRKSLPGTEIVLHRVGVIGTHPRLDERRDPRLLRITGDPYISLLHARLFQLDGAWYVEDLGTTNGTWVDGVRIQMPYEVGKGSRVTVGRTEIICVPC